MIFKLFQCKILVGLLVGWLVCWLVGWVVGWLVGHGQMVTGEMRMIEILVVMGQLGIVGWLVVW